jgi:formate dehydrogenase maturation protein FdhE
MEAGKGEAEEKEWRNGNVTWKCRICNSKNKDDTVICSECGSYKHEDYDALSDEENS